ncbi:hypothetical protein [Kitasatospora griseola]|uniref:hypothetical protein n=1 Tax=Kitasatospora griseola TaxID=2064 RepID=UPI0038056951
MDTPKFWVHEGSRRRPHELANNPAYLPANASPLIHPPPEPAHSRTPPDRNDTTSPLATAEPDEFAAAFRRLVSGRLGAVEQLHGLLSDAATWCQAHDARQYRDELEVLADRVADLGEELHLVNDSLGRELASRSTRQTAAVSRSPSLPPLTTAAPIGTPRSDTVTIPVRRGR